MRTMQRGDVEALVELISEPHVRFVGPIRDHKRYPQLRWTKVRGHACNRSWSISLPIWIFRYTEPYIIYYVCHELTHLFWGIYGHDEVFKHAEQVLMKRWGVEVVGQYKAYPKIHQVGFIKGRG